MSRNISDDKLLMEIQVEQPEIIIVKDQENNMDAPTINEPVQEAPLQDFELTSEERDSIQSNLNQQSQEANKVVDYHAHLIATRYGGSAARDFLDNGNRMIK